MIELPSKRKEVATNTYFQRNRTSNGIANKESSEQNQPYFDLFI